MEILLKIVGNTLLVSLPEETFITMIVYFFSNKQIINILDFTRFKANKALILIPAITSALTSNIVRYLGYQNSILGFLAPIILLVLTIYINLQYNYKNIKLYKIILNTLKGLFIAFFLVLISNLVFVLPIINLLNKPITEIDNIIINFVYSLPCAISQYIILFLITQKYNKKIDIIKLVLESEICKKIIILLIMFSTILMITGIKLVLYDQLFIGYEIWVIPLILVIPLLIVSLLVYKMYIIGYNIKMKSFDEIHK
jgi:hypothetical protein